MLSLNTRKQRLNNQSNLSCIIPSTVGTNIFIKCALKSIFLKFLYFLRCYDLDQQIFSYTVEEILLNVDNYLYLLAILSDMILLDYYNLENIQYYTEIGAKNSVQALVSVLNFL